MTDTENNKSLPEELNVDEVVDLFITKMPGSDELEPEKTEEIRQELREELRQMLEEAEVEQAEADAARAELLANETPEQTKTREILENLYHPERAGSIECLLKNQRMHDKSRTVSSPHQPGSKEVMKDILLEENIAKIYDSMISFDLVGVQPMQGPVGLLYSLRYRFNEKPEVEETDEEKSFMDSYVPFNDEIDITPKTFTELTKPQKMRLSLDVISAAIEARTKKLSCGWTVEAMQDLNAQHGLDIETEMRSAMVYEIALENDYEILMDLRHLAKYEDGVSANGSRAKEFTVADDYMTSKESLKNTAQNLSVEIHRAANDIARCTRRGAGNWIVVSPAVCSVLQAGNHFDCLTLSRKADPSFTGLSNVGILNNTIQVYVDSYASNNNVLVGYKGGNGETDTGYVWTPYVPVISSGVVINPLTFQPIVSLMTRAGKYSFKAEHGALGNSSDYYRLIEVNLPEDVDADDNVTPTVGVLSVEEVQDLLTQGKEISDNIQDEFKSMLTGKNDGIVVTGDEEEV